MATVYNFTSAGVFGRVGPTQSQLDAAYAGTTLEGKVTSSNGIQLFTVPVTGSYIIEAVGAQGGSGTSNPGGKGARIKGTMTLTAGDVIKILVGQMPQSPVSKASGGGGASYVVKDTTPLIIAGGGGGWSSSGGTVQNASLTTAGVAGSQKAAGSVGYGGQATNDGWGGGGAGWLSNGGDGGQYGHIAYSFLNGGLGGNRYDSGTASNYSEGGFGGGGGSGNDGGGGGGGYTGGGGSGGAGGSYNTGTDQEAAVYTTGGSGYVTITSPDVNYYLVLDGSDVKAWDATNSIYTKVADAPVTLELLKQYGVPTLPLNRTGLISPTPTVYTWVKSGLSRYPTNAYITGLPKPQVITMNYDVTFGESYIKSINNILYTGNIDASAIVTVAFSGDGGAHWYTFQNNSWSALDITDPVAFSSTGIKLSNLASITSDQWMAIFTQKTIRMAIYMELPDVSVNAILQNILVNYNV